MMGNGEQIWVTKLKADVLHSAELKKPVYYAAMKSKIDVAYRLELKKSTHQKSRVLKTDALDSSKLAESSPKAPKGSTRPNLVG